MTGRRFVGRSIKVIMTKEQLRDYVFWIGKSPVEVRAAAIAWGGWSRIFPMEVTVTTELPGKSLLPKLDVSSSKFPEAQSRVRNFFNITPKYLTRLPQVESRMQIRSIKGLRTSVLDAFTFPFNGDVYVDESRRYWFQMKAAGAVYHYPGKASPLEGPGCALGGANGQPGFQTRFA
jgi:hypothetical protein